MAGEASSHVFRYPAMVAEITCRMAATPDDFMGGPAMVPVDLYPRIHDHCVAQLAYYERCRQETSRQLARAALLYSGQLALDLYPGETADGKPA